MCSGHSALAVPQWTWHKERGSRSPLQGCLEGHSSLPTSTCVGLDAEAGHRRVIFSRSKPQRKSHFRHVLLCLGV